MRWTRPWAWQLNALWTFSSCVCMRVSVCIHAHNLTCIIHTCSHVEMHYSKIFQGYSVYLAQDAASKNTRIWLHTPWTVYIWMRVYCSTCMKIRHVVYMCVCVCVCTCLHTCRSSMQLHHGERCTHTHTHTHETNAYTKNCQLILVVDVWHSKTSAAHSSWALKTNTWRESTQLRQGERCTHTHKHTRSLW